MFAPTLQRERFSKCCQISYFSCGGGINETPSDENTLDGGIYPR